MKDISFTLETGKEVSADLAGIVVRGTVPTTPKECLAKCGGDNDIMVSVFNEGLVLNHFQKIAKRAAVAAAKKNLTGDAAQSFIQAAVDAHKPGVKPIRTGGTKVASVRKQALSEMQSELDSLPPEIRAKWQARLDALKPVRKPKTAENGAAAVTEPVTA